MVLDLLIVDKRSEISFVCAVQLLPAPPTKSVKRPRVCPEELVKNLFMDFKVSIANTVFSVHCNGMKFSKD